MNLENTKAFSLYVDDKFISTLNPKHSFSIDEEEAESLTQNAICKYLIAKIQPMLKDFNKIKREYLDKVKNISPLLDSNEAKQVHESLQDKLENQYKLHFCTKEIQQDFYEIEVAKILFFIHAKLLNIKNPEKYKYSKDKYQYNRIYKYLKLASLELSHQNIDEYFSYTINELVDELFYNMVMFNYHNDDFTLNPLLGLDLQDVINTQEKIDPAYDGEIDTSILIDVANECLKNKLIDEMHTLDINKTF